MTSATCIDKRSAFMAVGETPVREMKEDLQT